jgi:hypothetical protein
VGFAVAGLNQKLLYSLDLKAPPKPVARLLPRTIRASSTKTLRRPAGAGFARRMKEFDTHEP